MNLNWSDFKNIVILTGAGISADSGLKTFRDSKGLWENYHIEDVATPEAFDRQPHLVWKFYSMRRLEAANAQPNLAHITLAEFSRHHQVSLITQNVDGLHDRANTQHSLSPICMHGSLNQSRCTQCGTIYFDDQAYFDLQGNYAPQNTIICDEHQKASPEYLHQYHLVYKDFLPLSPCCNATIRPHIVWFGEMPLFMARISKLIETTDIFISIGTSGSVYPAAGFLELAKKHHAKTICINMEETPQHNWIDHFIQGRAAEKVPQIFKY